ncbi:MAG: sn-glycerol 3-phosphate transport system ATP-binding protein [Bacteroidales bacterium]|nr:sn-glycerol 3-phosphate transport system ATP-binding protein [Bacteroidales bacterium]MDN5291351.1 sn-glycerol 3-phosphate transport system ATP-binding protein [Anaerophaga sp.]
MQKIELISIDKAYEVGNPIIENLNLNIDDGSFTVLLGPSGCGKSTILRMIAGLEKETGGEIFIGGKTMQNVEPGDRDIAMVFQNYALYPTMTVRGNIEFGLENNKIPKDERNTRIHEICDMIGITEYLNRKPQSLSGGQRQRVALARAMVKKPSVFLMDEPLSNLDAKLRSQIRTELIELYHNLKTTFVYVTHDQVEAMSMGTHIILLNKGEIMQQGSPIEIYNNPQNIFTAQFIGTPPMNILKMSDINNFKRVDDDVAYVGFRPEHVQIAPKNLSNMFAGSVLRLTGKIVTHEVLGSEILYKVETPSGVILLKIFDLSQIFEGEISVVIPEKNLCYFDHNENRIIPREIADGKQLCI